MAALLFGESSAESIGHCLEGHLLIAPTLLGYELASIFLKKAARHPGKRQDLLEAFGFLSTLGIEEVAVPTGEIVAVAESSGLSAYDSAYLWLARELGAELVTLDQRLQRAAARL